MKRAIVLLISAFLTASLSAQSIREFQVDTATYINELLDFNNVNQGLGYGTIQAAVNDAAVGDAITVDAGTYAEPLNITVDGISITGADQGTLNGFAFHDGATGAPILDQAPAYIDCEVRQHVDVGNHTFFIGEVVDCGFQMDEATEVLRMEDTRMNYGG